MIVWLVEPLFPDIDQLHSVFELRERHTGKSFGDQLAIHVLQLSALSREGATGYDSIVERWARFLVADDSELERLAVHPRSRPGHVSRRPRPNSSTRGPSGS